MRTLALTISCLAAISVSLLPSGAFGFSLATPAAQSTTHAVYCVITNLHPTKTCSLNGALYGGPGLMSANGGVTSQAFLVGFSTSVPPGATYTSAAVGPVLLAVSCRFDVTGCRKANVRAALAFDGGATIPAY